MDVYATADRLLNEHAGGSAGTTVLWQPRPVSLHSTVIDSRSARIVALREFFDVSLEIFRGALAGELQPEILDLLLNDTLPHLGITYHRSVPEAVYRRPAFFRTDESADGQIFELQAPGSGWGDLQLLRDVYLEAQPEAGAWLSSYQPAQEFAAQVVDYCGHESPSVMHLLDSASAPAPMRYHILKSQPPLRYWGYDRSVEYDECRFIRSHSFIGLTAENYFERRMRQAADGEVLFDLPPIVLFDQKAPLALPFWAPTRDFFSDDVRECFAYTAPLTHDGFVDADGEHVSIDAFVRRPKSRRRYFLKYAGSDVSRNWGSRSVLRLHGGDCQRLLDTAVKEGARGAHWVIQPAHSVKTVFSVVNRQTLEDVSGHSNAKYSCFYGPGGIIGVKTMHRAHFKVHGQSDTTIGLGMLKTGTL